MSAPTIPRIIDCTNMDPLFRALEKEPCYQPGAKTKPDPEDWHQQLVWLEFPTGEAARDGLTTLALLGNSYYETASLSGKEGFLAQGLEGKVRVQKTLFPALMNLRDILPKGRGWIVTR